jgi:hypothetical protein
MAGADAVEVGTASLRDPRAPMKVLAGLAKWCRRHNVSSVRELVGGVQMTVARRTPETESRQSPSHQTGIHERPLQETQIHETQVRETQLPEV